MTDWATLNLGIHALGAVVWVAGSFALGFVTYALRKAPDAGRARISAIARTLTWVMWPALAITVVTGGFNTQLAEPSSGNWFAPPAVGWLDVKLAAVAVMTAAAGTHSFLLGPKVRRLRESGADATGLASLSRWSAALGIVSTLASVAVVGLGVALSQL